MGQTQSRVDRVDTGMSFENFYFPKNYFLWFEIR